MSSLRGESVLLFPDNFEKAEYALQKQANKYVNVLFRRLLIATCLALSIFVVINLANGLYVLSVVELFFALICLFIYKKVGVDKSRAEIAKLAKLYLILLYSGVLFSLVQDRFVITSYVWVLLFPSISYILLGKKWGAIYTAGALIASSVIFTYSFYNNESIFNPSSFLNALLGMLVIWLLAHEYESWMQKFHRKLIGLASSDSLTGLYNREPLEHIYTHGLAESERQGSKLSLILLDIDFFKRVNDNYGHASGDTVLRLVSDILRTHAREGDFIFRLGGEEFCIILPVSSSEEAQEIAEEIRLSVAEKFKEYGAKNQSITISIGIAESEHYQQTMDELFRAADERLYMAKSMGRNRVVAGDEI